MVGWTDDPLAQCQLSPKTNRFIHVQCLKFKARVKVVVQFEPCAIIPGPKLQICWVFWEVVPRRRSGHHLLLVEGHVVEGQRTCGRRAQCCR